jgi:hypothetical protein
MKSLMQQALGADWDKLPAALQAHYRFGTTTDTGSMDIEYPRFMQPVWSILRLLGALVDRQGKSVTTIVEKRVVGEHQIWRRTITYPDGAVAAQQLDLHVVERVEVGEAVADRALEQRVGVEQFGLAGDLQQRVDRGLCSARMRGRSPARSGVLDQLGVAAGDGEVGSWPAPCPCSTAGCGRRATRGSCLQQRQAVVRARGEEGAHRAAEAVPARQHQAALRPAEHPRNRAQVLDGGALLARGRAAADVERGDLAITVDSQK